MMEIGPERPDFERWQEFVEPEGDPA